MAHVSIRWGQSASHHLNYVQKDRAPNDVTYAHDCGEETAIADFSAVRAEHGQEGGNQVLHVVQSFSPIDSRLRDADALNALGRSLALEVFPGHQFLVRTHTDTEKTHNHIVVNIVNSETGKKIENKRALIFRLRDSSDKLCKENGLSVINRESKERAARLPHKAQEMVRAGKFSYLLDLSQKADVARSIATNFDEYRDTMHAFGIRVLIEEKNISYFYPGRERGKRGSKLGRLYDKAGLVETFEKNQEKFARRPGLRAEFQTQCAQIVKYGMPKTPEGVSRFRNLWSGKESAWSVPQPEKISRRDSKAAFHSDEALTRQFVPANEIKRAREGSIFEYCKQNNIALKTNEKGDTVFKGREFVVVSEFEFQNTKNGTRGSLIDVVAAHKNMTLLQAAAHLNGNNRLLLLERTAGEVSQKFRSFFVPKPEKSHAAKISGALSTLSRGKDPTSSFQAKLSELSIERMGQKGGVWLFMNDEPNHDHLAMQHELALITFMHINRATGVPTVHRETERMIDVFLIHNPSVKTLNFVSSKGATPHSSDSFFFESIKRKYLDLGIDIVAVPHEKALQMSLEIETPRIETHTIQRSRGRGGPDFGF